MQKENPTPNRFALSGMEAVVVIVLLFVATMIYGLSRSSSSEPKFTPATPSPYLVMVNQCSVKILTALPGIGEQTAQRIIHYRNTVGDIKNFDEFLIASGLSKVKGSEVEPLISFALRKRE